MAKKAAKKSIVLKITGTEYALRTPVMLLASASNPIFQQKVEIQVEKGGEFVPFILDYHTFGHNGFEDAFKRIVE